MVDLDELERLEREATPGPWELEERMRGYGIFAGRFQDFGRGPERVHGLNLGHVSDLDANGEDNLALILAARNALPDLLAELRMLRAAHEEREAMHAAYGQGIRTAYETGRRDALRGVQAAALYRHAELWHGRVRLTSADERRDIEACELAWAAAEAAEEAAR